MPEQMTFFEHCGVVYLDHVAVTTADLGAALHDYLALPGARLLRGPADNPGQGVRYAFVLLPGGNVVELLAPLQQADAQSPIARHLAAGAGAYHLCHAVRDMRQALAAARDAGARIVKPPLADPAFDGRQVAFLVHPLHGLVEFVEALPGATAASVDSAPGRTAAAADSAAGGHRSVAEAANARTAVAAVGQPGDIRRLDEILHRLLPELAADEVAAAALGVTPGWDSLLQIRLIMEVEQAFGIEIPAERIPALASYAALARHLAGGTPS